MINYDIGDNHNGTGTIASVKLYQLLNGPHILISS